MYKYFKLLYNKEKKEYFKYLDRVLEKKEKKFIITVNPESIMYAERCLEFKDILLNEENSLTPDGVAIIKKAKQFEINIPERITGIDIAYHLLYALNDKKGSLYLFGSTDKVLSSLVNVIKKQYPSINILGYNNGYINDKEEVFKKIIKLKPDVCMVALGIPMQELLINKYINKFEKGIFIGVGGSFDVISGIKKRAPKVFINHNAEWLYRIINEPKRLKRFYNNNIKFLFSNSKQRDSRYDKTNK